MHASLRWELEIAIVRAHEYVVQAGVEGRGDEGMRKLEAGKAKVKISEVKRSR